MSEASAIRAGDAVHGSSDQRRCRPGRALARQSIGLLLVCSASPGWAQDYPSRPVRMIVPYAAGGMGDTVARLIGQRMGEVLGQQFVVDNRAGAAGTLGTALVARAAPDGYTLLTVIDNHGTNLHLFKSIDYDTLADFAPITLLVRGPMMLVARSKFPPSTFAEVMQYARAKPGAINFATAGSGSPGRMLLESLRHSTGFNVTTVNYKGASFAMTDLMGNQVDLMFSTLPTAVAQLKAGRLKAIAVSSESRHEFVPDVPTIGESVPGFSGEVWAGMLAPAKTPPAIIARLNAEAVKALALPAIRTRLAEIGLQPVGSTPAELDRWVRGQTTRWGIIVREQKITLD